VCTGDEYALKGGSKRRDLHTRRPLAELGKCTRHDIDRSPRWLKTATSRVVAIATVRTASERYDGDLLLRRACIIVPNLNCTRSLTGSQCSCIFHTNIPAAGLQSHRFRRHFQRITINCWLWPSATIFNKCINYHRVIKKVMYALCDSFKNYTPTSQYW